ncbi:E3 ubiquitin protein ligase DRIP2-like isoform X2 [Raphanus sativus]|uniref:E3 ubiquitin protein ligase DRIP2-like isoform X2 n=1 Tax=Raphanus sativus TaxID=3726 RepID=A0A6J0JNH0_RAPSA|nr:E3 ubiquitin protein ligase DRIP2-like isoform X2 [Raphanus sativus]XP_056854492.1 E3 ubiquitin protein ligase DRIP2-like isoform X2 [Raphanus sativus]
MEEIVLKQNVVPLLNCPICKKLFDHPTNITECNHIFCRKCIEDKFTVENLKACPVCNVDLGVAPLNKLKLDNTWDYLKQKFFKPKKKSLASLGATSSGGSILPDALEQKKLGKQNNVSAGASTSKGCIQKENHSGKDKEEISVLSDDLDKSLSTTDKSNHTALVAETEITQNGKEKQKTVLTERISGKKPKNKGKEKQESFSTPRKVSGQKGKGKAYSFPPVWKPRMHVDMSSGGTSSQTEASNNKVWFSLIAVLPNQNINRPLLPQISSQYIRTDGNLPVSYVKKYVAKKLGLQSENEVMTLQCGDMAKGRGSVFYTEAA